MLNTSPLLLKILAALVWYVGVVVLLIKSTVLLLDANKTGASPLWIMLAISGGISIGLIKAKYLFIKICKRNIKRIEELKHPRLWQFYRTRFFFFLALMILLGSYLARWAQGDFIAVITLATVELSVAVALLISSHSFFIRNKD